ncbi:MAG TPA: penicillin-binding protein [Cyclobacteriaceae bacterium]|nr:penicillin-binding protein [Cyclobacteriaceae bacterium]
MNIRKSILLRVRLAFLAFFVFGAAIIGRIVYLQFFEGEKWQQQAEEIGLQYQKVRATRGNIYSDNGSLLITSLPFYRVAFDPTRPADNLFRREIDSLSLLLSGFFRDKGARDYRAIIENARKEGKEYIVLNKKEIKYQDKKVMSEWPLFRQGRMKGGVIFEKIDKRFYPFSNLGYRTVGYINQSNQGAGLEFSFNSYLGGKDGAGLFQKVAGGRWRPVYDGSEIKPVDGFDIQTTIDVNLQDVAQSALTRALIEHDADYGCAIVMEVHSGYVKAITNLSKTAEGRYAEIYNYAVGNHGLTDPGSTFKLASMITLLEKTNINLNDTVDTGKGEYEYYDRTMQDHKPGGFGKITVAETFTKSSNIGISKLVFAHFGQEPQKFIDHIKGMGLGKPVEFQMRGEGLPYIKSTTDRTWSNVSLPWMSIGYELTMTPIHTLTFYNAIANNGVMVRPIIVRSILDKGNVIEEYETSILNGKVCSKKTLNKIRDLLKAVVSEGTAYNIHDSYYPIAGKTGTAQKLVNGRYTRQYYTSFVGYFPANNPRYSCIVVIDNPKGYRQYGSDVAAPVFKEIADKIYAGDIDLNKPMTEDYKIDESTFPVIRAGFKSDLKLICNELGISNHDQTEEEWVRTSTVMNAVNWNGNVYRPGLVPNVMGMTLKDAIFLLENEGLVVSFGGKGRVVSQSQKPGTVSKDGTLINIDLE